MRVTQIVFRVVVSCVALIALHGSALAADDKIEQQRKLIASLERQVVDGEREVAELRRGKAATEQRVKSLARQVEARNRLLNEQRRNEAELRSEITKVSARADSLEGNLEQERKMYGEMVREAYRSYTRQNMMTYLFLSRDFNDMARRVSNMRAVAELRADRIERIDSIAMVLDQEQELLSKRKGELEGVVRNLTQQKSKLQGDVNSARSNITSMSAKERKVLQQSELKQRQLDAAISQLQKLVKGNCEGDTFTSKTSNLNLPVVGGRVKQYRDNMAEIVGAKGAKIISIYDGKVVEVKHNRITGKYDIYIAHGEYITSYAGLYSASVAKNQVVAKGGVIGVIGEAVDIITMASEYKIVFGIYPPTTTERVSAASCFKK